MLTPDLPIYPARGDRQKLDRRWLALLHRQGISGLLDRWPAPPAELGKAVAEFNQGRYWQCHETLEEIWLPEAYPLRLFYHGLIKAAVGLLHLERQNRHGATVKLEDAVYTLAPFVPRFMDINIARLRDDLMERLARLEGKSSLHPPLVKGGWGDLDWEAVDRLPAVRIEFSNLV